ncbi:Unannotated [Lentimonas sp. CC4]|nr:Unannotated [Lentimonas sp. CC4]CAA6683472.1 Unannotated [Lentimonas sp. CC6]CAA7078051.1 Unannotated [Lentimonas sp. CC4]CAA7171652.1 Unannotated [Lentimonas sp. CC21]CAA7181438.1 Unannotated [Lentimonas sp. CC8]
MPKFHYASLLSLLLLGACSEKPAIPSESPAVSSESIKRDSHTPTEAALPFSWETVPRFALMAKSEGALTHTEASYLAENCPIIIFDKSMEHALREDQSEVTVERAARQIKAINPGAQVYGYWNSIIAYNLYAAFDTFDANKEQWALRNADGSIYMKRGRRPCYDLSQEAVRNWWVDCAEQMLSEDSSLDGLLIDALPAASHSTQKHLWGSEKSAAIEVGLTEMVRQLDARVSDSKQLIYNGAGARLSKWEDRGLRFLESFDGVLFEHFCGCSTRDPKTGDLKTESLLDDLATMRRAVEAGKTVFVKAWPRSLPCLNLDIPITNEQATADLEFPLACFLLAAGDNCYFLYNWGYHNQDGQYPNYPEYQKPLGPPQGTMAEIEPGVYIRSFQHAQVYVNLNEESASIDWHSQSQ